ncbi:MAG: ATP-binding cassette domain-containing protein [Erysipelothrix sp.]|nr:ATP-binding cassette domain-containing protein [Erysipelothrix sp.]
MDHVSKTSTSFESLNLKDITVKFDNEVLFENLDLEIKKGDKILMVGPSGIGKSTLLRVIQKSLPTSEGTYVYNGAVQDEAVDGRFSLIRQHPLIFDDSLVYNITLGVNYSDEAIAEAIKDAQLEDVVNEKGLNYRVGESGKNLSIGELQRIEIARALITKRDIILADEITSALDTKFADNIREMLLASPYTVVEVAHKIDESEKSKYTHIWDVETFRK